MSDDLAEFLRRAAQRYGTLQPAQAEIVDADVVEDAEILDPGDVVSQDVGAHVAERLDSSGFARRASTLGANVGQSDDRMEAHLTSAFQHDLGQLGPRTSTPEDSILDPGDRRAPVTQGNVPSPFGVNLLAMLRDEAQLRNAIIMSEILRRPEHLW